MLCSGQVGPVGCCGFLITHGEKRYEEKDRQIDRWTVYHFPAVN